MTVNTKILVEQFLPLAPVTRLLSILCFCSLIAGGCTGASISVPTSFPVPIVDPVPLHVGLVLDEVLTGYEHVEELEKNGEWRISIGPAQEPMFDSLFRGLFAQHSRVNDHVQQPPNLHGVIRPTIEAVQFSTPAQTRTDYYEVWIRYEIKLYDQGELIAKWPITAYGKANVKNYGMAGTNPALEAAALAACRDAMAFFAVQFGKKKAVKGWMDSHAIPPSPTAAATAQGSTST